MPLIYFIPLMVLGILFAGFIGAVLADAFDTTPWIAWTVFGILLGAALAAEFHS